jgi:lipid-A-disaccharide synthase
MSKRLYIIAGEASGDLHGSNLIKALFEEEKDLEIRAWGGDKMEEAGATLVKHFRDLAFMGFAEVIMNLRTILRNISFCKKDILQFKPDALILIDYPGFNLRIAEWAHKEGIKVLYYISPQIWAWKKNRVFKIKRDVDKMFVILPFEKDFYKQYGMEVDFVGHPLMDEIEAFKQRAPGFEEFTKNNNLSSKPIIAIVPGSRKQEISKILPEMLRLIPKFPEYQFVIGAAPSIEDAFYEEFVNDENVYFVRNQTYSLFNLATVGMVASGTATLEAGIFGLPQVVCYKGNALSILIARSIIKVKYISLVNLIMDRELVKELIQNDLTTKGLEKELRRLLDPAQREKCLQDYDLLRQKLGGIGASKHAANAMLKSL